MKLEAAPEHKSFRDQKEDRPRQGGFQQRPQGQCGPRAGGNGGPRHNDGARRDQRPQGGGHSGGGGGARPGNPFNNPFAALLNQGNNKK